MENSMKFNDDIYYYQFIETGLQIGESYTCINSDSGYTYWYNTGNISRDNDVGIWVDTIPWTIYSLYDWKIV